MKSIKILLFVMIGIGLLAGGFFVAFNEKKPEGQNPERADALAQKMALSLHKAAWDSTAVVSWTFAGNHHYVWDKKNKYVEVIWSENRVLLNLDEWSKGKAFVNGQEVTDKEIDVLRGKAWSFFCNDSFWLIAPYKIFDEGVYRSIVKTKDNKEALLVSYASGGVTPGDAYLWHLDESGIPISYQMWVKIIPIGGVSATWESWQATETGAIIASSHKIGPMTIALENIKMGDMLGAIGLDDGLFDIIK